MPDTALSLDFFKRYEAIIDDWQSFAAFARMPLPTTVWTNTLKTSELTAAKTLNFEPISWYSGAFRCPSNLKPSTLLPYLAGHYQIQEEAALLPVHLLDPKPGETILDLCAAPGNKSVQMAVRMQSQGLVVANDRSRARLGILRRSISRLGLTNLALTVHDATSFRGHHNSYDKVLADVPCSGEGTIRRFKKNTPFISDKRRARLANIQSAILDKAIALCKPGGLIAYATCTFAPEENEKIVHQALQKHADSISMVQTSIEGLKTAPGVTSWAGESFHPDIQHAFRIWPHQNNTGGFFTAILKKTKATVSYSNPPTILDQNTSHEAPSLDPYLKTINERFGLPDETFSNMNLARFGKFMFIRSFGDLPLPDYEVLQTGLAFCRPLEKSQKLKTGAAMRWGSKATKNVLSLNESQAYAYGENATFEIDASNLPSDVTPGYVLLKMGEMYLGLGLLRMQNGSASIESLLPRHWISKLTRPETG